MSWYYIDGQGTTLGPVGENVIKTKFQSGELSEQSYVWNGTTVNEWMTIGSTGAKLHDKIKKKAAPGPPRGQPGPPGGRPAVKKKATGGRGGLLDAIKSGKKLNKVAKKDLPARSGGTSSGGTGGGRPKAGKMSLQDQLKMKLNKRNTGGATTKKAVSNPSKPASNFGQKSFGQKKASPFGQKKTSTASVGGPKRNTKSGEKMSKFEMKKAIDNCNDDWILKAITKLLS